MLHLVYCQSCSENSLDFLRTVSKLGTEYPNDLCVVDLDCLAACDTPPSVMLEYDFFPAITPMELYQRVHEHIDGHQPHAQAA